MPVVGDGNIQDVDFLWHVLRDVGGFVRDMDSHSGRNEMWSRRIEPAEFVADEFHWRYLALK